MASEARKPGGVFLVPPGGLREFFSVHECRVVPGIGPKAAQLLGEMGVQTLTMLTEKAPITWQMLFDVVERMPCGGF